MGEPSMVERVARAIVRAHNAGRDFSNELDGYTIDDEVESVWDLWLPEARAAIAAMREPTEAMIDATPILHPDQDESLRIVWRAMIDAGLAEGGD